MGKAQQKRAQNGPTKHQTLIPLPDPLLLTLGARCSTSLAARVCLVSAVRRFPAPPSDGIPALLPPAPLACERPVQPPPVGIPAPCTPASTNAATCRQHRPQLRVFPRAVSKLEAPECGQSRTGWRIAHGLMEPHRPCMQGPPSAFNSSLDQD
ncbi:hypothetical protein OsJ_13797 [Oryza sativa Japonica Group]|uniref:Uncharacterized protein n=1 Tax=Oryza sativa subsp. japonica TaxID=39947 RepID=B9FDN3_ORYSJ|nr:hypothetical protein OsJ_13797 [Oryza sativa Japonica Group]